MAAHKSNINIVDKKSTSKDIYFESGNLQSIKYFSYTLFVKLSANKEIQIAVNTIKDFEKITQLSIDSLYKDVRTDLLNQFNKFLDKRAAYKAIYNTKNNKLDLKTALVQGDNLHDFISLYPSFGMSIINSNFAPEIDVNIDFTLFKKNEAKYKFSVGYMYRKTGPHFNGDTWTAAWQYNKKHVGIKLGGYYTKNLEGNYVVIPSIGFNFGF